VHFVVFQLLTFTLELIKLLLVLLSDHALFLL
jgi:hypothetical protein